MKKEDEIWKDVPGYEGLYQVSTFGRIKSYDRVVKSSHGSVAIKRGRILALTLMYGYHRIALTDHNGFRVKYFVHRLVMAAFNPDDRFQIRKNKNHKLIQVDHINGIRSDNRLENLQYLSSFDNVVKSYTQGRKYLDRNSKGQFCSPNKNKIIQ